MLLKLNSTQVYLSVVDKLTKNYPVISRVYIDQLEDFVRLIYHSDLENRYSEPMIWIGMYIALASLYCIFAMVADLIHGVQRRKLWFPSKYFTINAFSLTVIAVAMKLPVDLTCPMPGVVDRVAKLGSMAFMCTIMANFLPCLATMDNNSLLANITALGFMVITLVVNVCIQIQTSVLESCGEDTVDSIKYTISKGCQAREFWVLDQVSYSTIAAIYATMLLLLLIIHVSSSLAILKFKQIIEPKYQQGHERASAYLQQSTRELLTVETLQQHVTNYWIMARSGSPQFIIACSTTTTASGVICVFTALLHTLTVCWTVDNIIDGDYKSDYHKSMPVILIVQFIGVILGTFAPLSRCFARLSFKVSIKSIWNHFKDFKVESYWTQKLFEWKDGSIQFRFRSHKRKVVLKNLKSLILIFCIKLQKGVVVVCKLLALIPFLYMICFLYCVRPFKWLRQGVLSLFGACRVDKMEPFGTENQLEKNPYVLQLEDEVELADRTLKGLSSSLNQLIRKSERKKPKNLINLIREKPTKGFQQVQTFDNNNCWSLAVVNLTTIVRTLRKIKKKEVNSLLKSVREGLEYVTLVENNLNATDHDYVILHKAAERLWQQVDDCHKWLGTDLKDIASQVITTSCQEDATLKIVQLFLEKAKNKIKGVGSTDGESNFTYICASSMSCITEAIIGDHNESHKKSFDELISPRIADIIAACLTNLPQVIAMKCHTNVIEKREASVQVAAKLLGETKEIIETLQDPSKRAPSTSLDDIESLQDPSKHAPSMNLDDLPISEP